MSALHLSAEKEGYDAFVLHKYTADGGKKEKEVNGLCMYAHILSSKEDTRKTKATQ